MTRIQQAWDTPCTQWSEIGHLIEEAETPEERAELESIQVTKYHLEEGRDI